MKKVLFISIICLSLIFLTAFKIENYDNDILSTDSKSAVLIEPTTMTVIYERNPHLKLAPASMTKIMTMLLVMEALENKIITLDQKLIASEYATKMGGTQIYLEVGEEMTVRDLLKSVAVGSANDASVVLAEGISGTVDNFVNLISNSFISICDNNNYFDQFIRNTKELKEVLDGVPLMEPSVSAWIKEYINTNLKISII